MKLHKWLYGMGAVLGVLGMTVQAVLADPLSPPEAPNHAYTPAAVTAASLHNPGFDNHLWYEFNDRYGTWLAGAYVPDDDSVGGPQEWRLWYMRGKPLITSFAEQDILHSACSINKGVCESVGMRVASNDEFYGGLYQIVYDTVPCQNYTFRIHALTRPDSDVANKTTYLHAGIDPTGWATDPRTDPAVPGAFPATTIWSAPQSFYYPDFGLLEVTAEAQNTQITVLASAQFWGGKKHALVLDSASLSTATPQQLHDPANLPAPGSLNGTPYAMVNGNAIYVNWTAAYAGMGQVYYRLVPNNPITPPDYPYKLYVPAVLSSQLPKDWQLSTVDGNNSTFHVINVSGLQSGATYEYLVITRGLYNGQCTSAVSPVQRIVIQ